MKKILISTSVLTFSVIAVYLLFFQTDWVNGKHLQDDKLKQPKIQFEKTQHDFGTVTEGESVEYIFRFTNIGNDTLVITNIRTSCGCTAALLSKHSIAPGESGEIKAAFDSQGRPGLNRKTIAVISNDPNRQQVVLSFTVNVEEKKDNAGMDRLFK